MKIRSWYNGDKRPESNSGVPLLQTFPLDPIVTLFCPSIDAFLCLH